MIFKSRQVNLDPAPFYEIVTRERAAVRGDIIGWSYQPRPEFEATRDPYPWESSATNSANGKHRAPAGYSDDGRGLFVWSPRREQFDTPVNPILHELGEYMRTESGQDFGLTRWAENWLANLEPGMGYTRRFTPEQIDHATRVLTRLANLTKEMP